MAAEVFMPKAGMDMQEGTIIRWLAEVGDEVHAQDPLLEIETDKVTMEVEAPADGVLLVKYFDDGAVVPVVTIIGYIGEKGEKVPDRPAMAGGQARADEEKTLREPKRSREFEYGVAVIGGGPAGYIAALRASRMGAKTILFEMKKLGGTCTNAGCIPTKTYVQTAHDLLRMRKAGERGITAAIGGIDMEAAYEYKESVIARMRGGVSSLLRAARVTVVSEEASLIGPHTIRAGQYTYSVENVILCGGSVPSPLPIEGSGLPGILSSDDILELKEVPESLVIVGGGVIGCEMAAIFGNFGSKVTIVELQEHLVPTFDADVSAALERHFSANGISILTGRKISRFDGSDGKPAVVLEDGERVAADYVLVSVGRRPNLSCLGVMADQIECERGKIMVDEYCRTNVSNIFACGDITNRGILAHAALKMGSAAAMTACGKPQMVNLKRAPLCLYTIPEAAGIGLTETQAKKRGEILIGRFPFSANGRAVAAGTPEGFVKVIADKGYGEILGVHIVGANATEMIVEAKILMDMEITVYEAADIMHPHPTYAEAFMEACADAIGESLNLPQRKN